MLHPSAEATAKTSSGGRAPLLAGVAVSRGLLGGRPPELGPLGGAWGGRGGDQAIKRLNAQSCGGAALPGHLQSSTEAQHIE